MPTLDKGGGMLFSPLVSTISALSPYSSLQEAKRELIALPVLDCLVMRSSLLGRALRLLYSAVYSVTHVDYEESRFLSVARAAHALFQEVRSFVKSERDGHAPDSQKNLRALSISSQVVLGACLDPIYSTQSARVFWLVQGIRISVADSQKLERERDLFHSAAASIAVFEDISGEYLNTAKAIVQSSRSWEKPEDLFRAKHVHRWVGRINKVAAALPSRVFLDVFEAADERENAESNGRVWRHAWNLYHAGLHIGQSAALPSIIPSIAQEEAVLGGTSTALVFDKDLSRETRSLHIQWQSMNSSRSGDDTIAKDPLSVITSHLPLAMGLWSQQRSHVDFIFPPIPLYSISPDGQKAVVAKPLCTLDSPRLWAAQGENQKSLPYDPVTICASFVATITSLPYTPHIDGSQHILLYSGTIASLCPSSVRSHSFSWIYVEKRLRTLIQERERRAAVYTAARIWGHPDIKWLDDALDTYGLQAQQGDLIRSCRLCQHSLKMHASNTLAEEAYQAVVTLQSAYEYVLYEQALLTEKEFLSLWKKVRTDYAIIIPTSSSEVSSAILNAMSQR